MPGRPVVHLLVITSFIALQITLASAATAAEIHTAATDGDLGQVETILDSDPNQIGERDESLCSPLHSAAIAGHLEVARLLVDRGADLRATDATGCQPLLYAALGGNVELAAMLLASGAPVDVIDDYENTPLMYAAYGQKPEMVELLAANGADVGHSSNAGLVALHFAARNGDLDLVKLLVEKGARVDQADVYGRNARFFARVKGHDDVVDYLRKRGVPDHYRIGAAAVKVLADDIRVITVPNGNRTNCTAFTSTEGTLLVDTGTATAAPRLRSALADLGDGSIEIIIATHNHPDHIEANPLIDSTATVIDFTNLEELTATGTLTQSEQGMRGRTDRGFDPHYTLRFGGEEIRIIPAAGTHSGTDVLIHFTDSGVVCTGSLVVSEAYPSVSAGSLDPYLEILATMIDVFPSDTVFIPGHGRPIDMEELQAYRRMAERSIRAVRAGMSAGKTIEEMIEGRTLAPWAAYGQCKFMPYQTDRVWISAIWRTLARDE